MNKSIILTIIGFISYTQHNFGMLQGNIIIQNGVTRIETESFIKYKCYHIIAKYDKKTTEFIVKGKITGNIFYKGLQIPVAYAHLVMLFDPLAHHA